MRRKMEATREGGIEFDTHTRASSRVERGDEKRAKERPDEKKSSSEQREGERVVCLQPVC